MSTQPTSPALSPDFRAVFESVPGLYLVLTSELKIAAASEAYLRATMTQREEILDRTVFETFPYSSEDPDSSVGRNLRSSLERVLMYRAPDAMEVQKLDLRKSHPDGGVSGVRYWIPVNSPVLGSDGHVEYIIHQVQDATSLVGLPQMPSAHEEPKHDPVLPPPVATPDPDPKFPEAHEDHWLLEKAYQELAQLSGDLEARVAERTAQLAQANAQLESELAERTRLESQLLHSQKLEAAGQLASGIAHDFNNLLTILQGYSDLLIAEFPEGSPQHQQLEEITRASDGAALLTRQLLAFSRQQLLEVKIIDLNHVVAEVGDMLRHSIGEDIEVVTEVDQHSCVIKADPGQVEQILVNLAVNARDAMPKGGKLTIETANVEIDEEYARDHVAVEPGPYVMLSISDTGTGMDPQVQLHIFEPFFTTKPPGRGTGLGLSTVYGVVKQSGGDIWLYSEPGHGTTFRIYLPHVAAAAEPVVVAPPAQEAGKQVEGSETILLVEDEEAVRSLVRKTLQAKGYTVLDAGSSTDALGILRQAEHPIDLVLTDVVLPGMSGPELGEAVRAAYPNVKLLYMSGYTDDTLLRHGVPGLGDHFIQKPFRPGDLARKIREVMDTSQLG